MTLRLQDKTALVTGGSHGIGRHIALRIAHEGARVIIADVERLGGEETAQEVHAAGGEATFLLVDVTDESMVANSIDEIRQRYGRLDVLVNNAGATPKKLVQEMSRQEWQSILDLNLTSMFLYAQQAYPLLLESPGAAVVNIASLHAYATVPGLAAYAAAKAGVVALTRSLALEFAPDIRVNAIAPGLIETEAWRKSVDDPEAAREHRLGFHPLGRLGKPADVAAAAAFLISDEAAFITGVVIPVDGGLMANLYREG